MEAKEVSQHSFKLFHSACYELFQSLGSNVSQIEQSILSDILIAYIDAGSNDVDVHIAMEIPSSVLALTYPCTEITEMVEEVLEDWANELSNQLMGRFKAKLYSHCMTINLGLPSVYFGGCLDEILPKSEYHYVLDVQIDGEECRFHLVQEFFSDIIDFSAEAIESADTMKESEIELF